MFDSRKILNENAYKRLQAIKEFSGMGSGFKIAMRDLEIRGAGSLLGAEQSGHIEKIGYNMYVDLISESVKEIRGERVERKTDIKVETNISAYLSHDYVSSASRRMALYKDIANIDTIDLLNSFKSNTESIYGSIPNELNNLCYIALLKNILCKLGVVRLILKKDIKLVFESRKYLTKEVIDAVYQCSEYVSLSVADLPIIEIKVGIAAKSIEELMKFVRLLINF